MESHEDNGEDDDEHDDWGYGNPDAVLEPNEDDEAEGNEEETVNAEGGTTHVDDDAFDLRGFAEL